MFLVDLVDTVGYSLKERRLRRNEATAQQQLRQLASPPSYTTAVADGNTDRPAATTSCASGQVVRQRTPKEGAVPAATKVITATAKKAGECSTTEKKVNYDDALKSLDIDVELWSKLIEDTDEMEAALTTAIKHITIDQVPTIFNDHMKDFHAQVTRAHKAKRVSSSRVELDSFKIAFQLQYTIRQESGDYKCKETSQEFGTTCRLRDAGVIFNIGFNRLQLTADKMAATYRERFSFIYN